nr:unnamed protein product [Spirometra erinaceieuropaei]
MVPQQWIDKAAAFTIQGHAFWQLSMSCVALALARTMEIEEASAPQATTIFVVDEDIKNGQLVASPFFHRKLDVREDGVEGFLGFQHLIQFDDEEGIIHTPSPQFRSRLSKNQRLIKLLFQRSCHLLRDYFLELAPSLQLAITQILQRWAEHFRGVLNRPSVISNAAIERLPQVETNVDLDLPPSLQETIRAVQQLSSGKAPGSDAIPAEVYKHGGAQLMDHLTALFQEIWRQGEVPQDFKDATIVHLYKRKGNRQVCDNHRGISLLNIAGKIFARILLNRLNNHLEQGLLPESQCGFRCHRGTTDMIFAARQLQEKCQEMRTHLYSTFVDLTKAFDTVGH